MLEGGARDEFLPRSGLAANQHGDRHRRDAANLLIDVAHHTAAPDNRVPGRTGLPHLDGLSCELAVGESPPQDSN